MIQLYTIGFTKKSAETFFNLLQENQVDTLVDTRLKPDSQLSGFAKQRDLPFLLSNLIDCDYQYMPSMTPEDHILKQYRSDKSWQNYEQQFQQLLQERDLIHLLDKNWWQTHKACLLCSEHEPDHCHRRLVAEYIADQWQDVEIIHLM